MPILKKKLIKIGTERFHVKTMSYFLHSKYSDSRNLSISKNVEPFVSQFE